MPLNVQKVKSRWGKLNTEVPAGADPFAAWILSPSYRGETLDAPGSTAWQCGGHSLITDRSTRPGLQAVLFDLDGVLVDTARFHYLAWKRLADELALPFDEHANLAFRGVGRMECLQKLLGDHARFFAAEEMRLLADIKNQYYLDMIKTLGPIDLAEGARELARNLHASGVRLALVSASRNARLVLRLLGITGWFDAIIDGSESKSKREGFLLAAQKMQVTPTQCLVIEDAEAGINGAREAGMKTAGIGESATMADTRIHSLQNLQLPDLERMVSEQ